MQEKVYPASEVRPFRPSLNSLLKSLNPGQAMNFQINRRNSVMASITRLHNEMACRYKTVRVSETEFAVVREQ